MSSAPPSQLCGRSPQKQGRRREHQLLTSSPARPCSMPSPSLPRAPHLHCQSLARSFSSSFHRPPPLPAHPGLLFHHTQPKSLLPFAATSSTVCLHWLPSSLSFFLSFLLCPRQLLIFRMPSVSLKESHWWTIVLSASLAWLSLHDHSLHSFLDRFHLSP